MYPVIRHSEHPVTFRDVQTPNRRAYAVTCVVYLNANDESDAAHIVKTLTSKNHGHIQDIHQIAPTGTTIEFIYPSLEDVPKGDKIIDGV